MAAKLFDRGKSVFEFRKGNLYEGKVEKRSSNYFKRGDDLGLASCAGYGERKGCGFE